MFKNYFHYQKFNHDFIDKFNVIVNGWNIPAGAPGTCCPIAVRMHKIIVTRTTACIIIILLLIILLIYGNIECLKNQNDFCRLAWYYTSLYSSRLGGIWKKNEKNTYFFSRFLLQALEDCSVLTFTNEEKYDWICRTNRQKGRLDTKSAPSGNHTYNSCKLNSIEDFKFDTNYVTNVL